MHINNLSSVESLKTLMKCHLNLSNLSKGVGAWSGVYKLPKKSYFRQVLIFLNSIHGGKKSDITSPSESSPPLGVRSYLNNPLLSCERKKFIFLVPILTI